MTLVRFYPGRSVTRINRDLNEAFNSLFDNGSLLRYRNGASGSWNPRVDVTENSDGFILNIELPGLNKDDLTIQFEDSVLKIAGERKKNALKEGESYLREERRYGKFSREFSVNTRIQEDKIEAAFNNGVLSILLPKAEEVKPKEIKIKA